MKPLFTRFTRTAFLAAAASIALSAPAAVGAAGLDSPACAAIEDSVLPPPDWYVDQCLGAGLRDTSAYRETPGLVPGDTAFYKTYFAPQSLSTAPLPTLNLTVIGPNPQALFAMAFDNPASTLYAVDNTTRQLGMLNQTTGAFTALGTLNSLPASMTVTGFSFDPSGGPNVYLTATDGTTANLWTINLANLNLNLVGPIPGFPFTVDIAIDNAGQMYGHDVALDVLIRIDKATGAATVVGPTTMNANFAQGMMQDPSDNAIYGCAFVIVPTEQGLLCRFNTTTGACVQVAGPVPNAFECDVRAARTVALEPAALAVDTAGNGVLQPNEGAVAVRPSWRNPNASAVANVTGALSAFTGPAGPLYTIPDAAASYGTIAANTVQQCTDCYAVAISAGVRPAAHWDATANETITPAAPVKTWRLHVGDSFTDVPASNLFYRFIETIVHRSVTGGCTPTTYCPLAETTREQMAVFVLTSKEGPAYTPAACGAAPMFSDVPVTSPFCRWIEELARRQVVSGCGGGNYCPTAPAARDQMAVFVLRTLDPALNPPACVAGSEMFDDVPSTSGFCRWVEELARRGVVTGCGGGNYCPTAPVTREQMSVFLSVTFSLVLYGLN